MVERENSTICGLPGWVPIPNNDTAAFINDVVMSAINVPLCVFAFIGNLAVIIAVLKTPSLQSPYNILLCSLATTDCLTGLIAQPIFVAWRLMIHRIHESCEYQVELFTAYVVSLSACTGWSFVNLNLISFDRHYAIANPLAYRASVTNKEAILAIILTGITWVALAILMIFFLPGSPAFIMSQVLGAILFILPIVNHVGIFTAIRRHNSQVAGVVTERNLSVIFRREKKAAIDMVIVIAVLMLCLVSMAIINLFAVFFPDKLAICYVWSMELLYLNSSINPIIYWARNSQIRGVIKSMMRVWMGFSV